jgi:hypothetical protein
VARPDLHSLSEKLSEHQHIPTTFCPSIYQNLIMVYISVSITAPVNPPGASSSPTLTQSDLWAALVAKARHPEEFVPEIARSTILHEDEQGLTRNVLFGGSMAERGEVEEHIKYYSPSKVCTYIYLSTKTHNHPQHPGGKKEERKI